ncbi:restriction endonuclease subunit S [Geotalea sp. SG265]|uniref:restriction endonuclease subunit S n=1 Tax=Geotalea sp. SG265 TaxID=2922867 RepID=UPI001FAFC416|nr:restriction endonuclease subunit S [Geotalea sp. SG265]
MIPKSWKRKRLADVATVQTGIAKGSKRLDDAVELPYLRVANVQDGYLDLSILKKIEIEKKQVERYRLHVGDVLLTEGGDYDKLGRGTVWQGEIEDCVHQNHVFIARPKREIILPQFLSLLTGSSYGKTYFLSCSKQSTNLASINSSQLKEFPVFLPTIAEQTAIADLLSTWDGFIKRTERLIAAKEKRYWGLVDQSILSPARSNPSWNHQRICDIAERIQRKSDGGDYPILTISSASGFVLQKEKYNRFMAGKSLDDYTLLRRGEFAYNKGNSLRYQFGCIFPLEAYEQALVPHVYVCFKPTPGIDVDYLDQLFQSDYLKPQLAALVNTGVRNNGLLNISPTSFMKVTVPFPSLGHQRQIAAILTTARREIDLLKQQIDAVRRQKRGIMQKLLTGKWRVKLDKEVQYG